MVNVVILIIIFIQTSSTNSNQATIITIYPNFNILITTIACRSHSYYQYYFSFNFNFNFSQNCRSNNFPTIEKKVNQIVLGYCHCFQEQFDNQDKYIIFIFISLGYLLRCQNCYWDWFIGYIIYGHKACNITICCCYYYYCMMIHLVFLKLFEIFHK